MNNLEIKRISNQEELNECLKIRRTIFIIGMNVPQSIEVDEHDCLNGDCDHFLVRYNHISVGTIRCLFKSQNTIQLQRFGFYDEYRRLGFGRKTLHYIEDYYRNKGYSYTILDAQIQALEFYKKNGYQKKSDIFMEAGIQHIKMEKYIKQ